MTTETKAAFARRVGVNRSTVNRWESKGWLVMAAGDLVEVEASQTRLAERPSVYRGGQAKPISPPAPTPTPSPQSAADPTEFAVEGLATVVRSIGAFAAQMAIDFGASLQVAYALDQAVCIEASTIADNYLTASGVPGFTGGYSILEYQGQRVVEPNWEALAERTGTPLDLDVLSRGLDSHPYFRAPEK